MVRSIQCNIVNVLTHASVHKWGQDLFAIATAGVNGLMAGVETIM